MFIHRSNESINPILIKPNHDPDKFKTPSLQKVERQTNVTNDKAKMIAKQATDKVYETLQKIVKNTEYNVSFSLGEMGESKQFKFLLKKSGEEIVSLPPDVAVNIAEKSKQTSIGLLMDVRA